MSSIMSWISNPKKIVHICDALRDLVTFIQFKQLEKHPWWSVTFSKAAGFSLQLYSGLILESMGIRAIFQKKGKQMLKRAKYFKIWPKMYKI